MGLSITILPALRDNYIYMLKDSNSGLLAAVDPSEALPVLSYLENENQSLHMILNTHHHWDHTGGNEELKKHTGCEIIGGPGGQIPGIDRVVNDGDIIELGSSKAQCLGIPGHTLDQIAFWFERDKVVFTGDTLFSIGCGRIFEGTPRMMWESLCKIRNLPDETKVYCGHEYTEKNLEFALTLEPQNADLLSMLENVHLLRSENKPSIPTTIGMEKNLNPFLRADILSLKRSLGLEDHDTVQFFSEIRKRKDRF